MTGGSGPNTPLDSDSDCPADTESGTPHVALVTSWGQRGGIADYATRLVESLRAAGATVTPVALRGSESSDPRPLLSTLNAVPDAADVVHTQFEAGLFGRVGLSGVWAPAYFGRLRRLPQAVVTTFHEVHECHDHLSLPADLLVQGRDLFVERTGLWASDVAVVHTTHAHETLQRRHGLETPIERLLHPVETDATPLDPEVARAELGVSPPVVVTFGWVEPKKRYDHVLEALPSVPEATYLIAGEPRQDGDESYLETVLADAAAVRVADRVHHLGYVSESALPTLFSAADVVVLPYDRVSQSGAVNVALAYRQPVVTTALPAFEELEDEFGCLTTYDNPAELPRVLETVLSDGETREQLTTGAEAYTETVTWERFAERTLVVYDRALSAAE